MCPGLRFIDLDAEYNTEDNDLVREFYGPCFRASKIYDRAVGYFRASIFFELGEDLLNFALLGGKTRICCSPDIPIKDENAARDGYLSRDTRCSKLDELNLIGIMEEMSNNPDEIHCLNILRLLIETERLDLFVATREGGIYHRKIGAFTDEFGDYIVFSGSGNETLKAVSSVEKWGNDEEFDVFRSWGEDFESGKAHRKYEYLQKLFDGGTGGTVVRPLNKLEREFLSKYRDYKNIEDALSVVRNKKINKESAKSLTIQPRPYQSEAIRNWERNGNVGMFVMATGTGKTLTALFAIKDLVYAGVPTLIVVPSTILLEQWHEILVKFFNDVPILCAGGGHDWKQTRSKRMFITNNNLPKIVLSTMQTASSSDFLEFYSQATDALLVVDEAHRLGSAEHKKILNLDFKAILGLSATPERPFDEEGMIALNKSFGTNPVYELPISAQVDIGDGKKVSVIGNFLSRYHYFFETVALDAEEMREWKELTEKIRIEYFKKKNDDASSNSERLTQLLINRARIVKNASSKVGTAARIIRERYPPEGRWLLYCDNMGQMNSLTDKLKREFPETIVMKYHSGMKREEKNNVLSFFERNPSIIVSIKCLDEGVDIPNADGAVILASSTNPREYIQRRGRVLRKCPGKRIATIIDILVLTDSEDEEDVPISLIKNEIARASEFAASSDNSEIVHELWKICREYNVDLDFDKVLGLEYEWE